MMNSISKIAIYRSSFRVPPSSFCHYGIAEMSTSLKSSLTVIARLGN